MYEHATCSSHFPNNQLFSPHKLDRTSGICNNTNNITHNNDQHNVHNIAIRKKVI